MSSFGLPKRVEGIVSPSKLPRQEGNTRILHDCIEHFFQQNTSQWPMIQNPGKLRHPNRGYRRHLEGQLEPEELRTDLHLELFFKGGYCCVHGLPGG